MSFGFPYFLEIKSEMYERKLWFWSRANNVCKSSWTSKVLTKKIRVESICAHGFNQALGFKISLCFYLFWEEPRSAKVLVEVDEGPHFALETKWTDPREWSRDHLRGSAVSSYLLKSAVPRRLNVEFCYFWKWFKKDWKMEIKIRMQKRRT